MNDYRYHYMFTTFVSNTIIRTFLSIKRWCSYRNKAEGIKKRAENAHCTGVFPIACNNDVYFSSLFYVGNNNWKMIVLISGARSLLTIFDPKSKKDDWIIKFFYVPSFFLLRICLCFIVVDSYVTYELLRVIVFFFIMVEIFFFVKFSPKGHRNIWLGRLQVQQCQYHGIPLSWHPKSECGRCRGANEEISTEWTS